MANPYRGDEIDVQAPAIGLPAPVFLVVMAQDVGQDGPRKSEGATA